MSRSGTARFARHYTSWLLLILCLSLLAWRIDYRIEQCHASTPPSLAVAAYFDANERNVPAVDETHLDLHTRVAAERSHLPLDLDSLVEPRVPATERTSRPPENPPAIAAVLLHPVTTLPNPPPSSIA